MTKRRGKFTVSNNQDGVQWPGHDLWLAMEGCRFCRVGRPEETRGSSPSDALRQKSSSCLAMGRGLLSSSRSRRALAIPHLGTVGFLAFSLLIDLKAVLGPGSQTLLFPSFSSRAEHP